jgi:hypothetical protein
MNARLQRVNTGIQTTTGAGCVFRVMGDKVRRGKILTEEIDEAWWNAES